MKIDVSIVIPLYNEEPSLEELVDLLEQTAKKTKSNWEYIFIDDGSIDGTFESLKRIKGKITTPLTIVKLRKKTGKSSALTVGFQKVRGEIIVTIDADLQDDPREIPKLLTAIDNGNDFVVGWRKDRQDTKGKIFLSRIFNGVVSRVYDLPLHDMNCGMKAFKKAVVQEVDIYGELHRYMPALAHARGFRVVETVIIHKGRKYGKSKFDSRRIIQAAFDLASTIFLTSFKNSPLQAFGRTGAVFGLVGFVILVYLSYLHFLGESIGFRPLLSLGILFLLFGAQMFYTGLLGELIISRNRNKEVYPVDQVIEPTTL